MLVMSLYGDEWRDRDYGLRFYKIVKKIGQKSLEKDIF